MTYDFEPRIYENVAECNYEYFSKHRLRGKRAEFRWSCDWKGFSIGARYNVCWVVYLGPLQLVIDRHSWYESPQEFMRRTNLLIRGVSFISASQIAAATIMANKIQAGTITAESILAEGGTITVKKPPPFEMYPTPEKPEPQEEE